jgi:hypothetical protein
MTNVIQISRPGRGKEREQACVLALHCSLGSGRQWMRAGPARHVARANEFASVPLALEAAPAGAVSQAEG